MGKLTISSDEKRWRAEEDLRMLRRVEELKGDPARMREAQKLAQKELASLQRVTGTNKVKSSAKPAPKTNKKK